MQPAVVQAIGLARRGGEIAARLQVEDASQPGGVGRSQHLGQAGNPAGGGGPGDAHGGLVSGPLRCGGAWEPRSSAPLPTGPRQAGGEGNCGPWGRRAVMARFR